MKMDISRPPEGDNGEEAMLEDIASELPCHSCLAGVEICPVGALQPKEPTGTGASLHCVRK
jgi:ferredoxin